jgi:hypothetical protein
VRGAVDPRIADLDPWLERARSSPVASFANGVTKYQAAVAIASSWPNGQTVRSNHQAQAGETPDVWSREARSSPSALDRRSFNQSSPNLRQSQYSTPVNDNSQTDPQPVFD